MKEISQRIFDLLKAQGKTQKELAAVLGIDPSSVAGWKRDNTNPKAEYLPLIAKFLNVSGDYLLGLSDSYNNAE